MHVTAKADYAVRAVVELVLPDGSDVWAQVTRASAEELELAEGQILPVRLPAPRVFAGQG